MYQLTSLHRFCNAEGSTKVYSETCKEKSCNLEYSAKKGDIKNFSDKQRVKDYSNTQTRIHIERPSPNRKEARISRKGKTTIGEVNI